MYKHTRLTRFVLLIFLALSVSALHGYPPSSWHKFDSMAIIRISVPALGVNDTAFTVTGPAHIWLGDPYDPGDGRTKIDTEMESLVMSGVTPFGPALIRVIPPGPGEIQQIDAGVDFPATSFFDVMVEIVAQSPIGPITVFSDPNKPVRMMAVINDLPPFDAQYKPEGSFVGVDLVDGTGNVVGFLSHVGHFVGQQPTFSVAPQGPSKLNPADLFKRATAPAIREPQLGLGAANEPDAEKPDDVDGLSYGFDFVAPPFFDMMGRARPSIIDIRFSPKDGSRGQVGSAVQSESSKSPSEAHGDEFRVTPFAGIGGGSNVQVLDENGDTAPEFPLLVSDDVDALTEPPPSFVAGEDGVPVGNVYFSLGKDSPSLATVSAPMASLSPADILVTSGGNAPMEFIKAEDMGLDPVEDDVDAFCLNAIARTVLFSLTSDSKSLAGASGADLFFSVQGQQSFFPWATAVNLGLLSSDDLNALKCHVGEIETFWDGKARVQILNNGEVEKQIEMPCHAEVIIAGHDLEYGTNNDLPFVLSQLKCDGEDADGPVHLTTRLHPPFEVPFGSFEGPSTEDRRMTGPAAAQLTFTPQLDGWGMTGLHGPNAILLVASTSTGATNLRFELRRIANGQTSASKEDGSRVEQPAVPPYPLFLEGGIPTPFALGEMSLELDARPQAEFTGDGFRDAASFGGMPSAGGLASLFGTFPTVQEAAQNIPLPRRMGDNLQVLFEVDLSAAALGGNLSGPREQGTMSLIPAPLLFVNAAQLNIQIPWEVDTSSGTVSAVVRANGVNSEPVALPVAPTSPGMFTADFGAGRAIAINGDGTLAQPMGSLGASHPAMIGDAIVLLLSGLGETTPGGVSGRNSFDLDGNFVRRDAAPVKVLIGGVEAQVVFSGLSPEFVGVFQINAVVPAGVAPGDAVSLVIEAGGRTSRADVTIAVSGP